MENFRQTAIKINEELLTELNTQLILTRLVRDLTPPKAYQLVGADLEKDIFQIEEKISRVKARKQTLLKEE